MSNDAVGPQRATPKTCRQIEAQTKQVKAELATAPVRSVRSLRQQRTELRRAGFLPGETGGSTCVDCGKQCGRGWWMRVSYEYDEWECRCRDCAYTELHKYDVSRCQAMSEQWIKCSDRLPPNDELVWTKIDDQKGCRNEQLLRRVQRDHAARSLWFFDDYSMYVYYEPTHWRPK